MSTLPKMLTPFLIAATLVVASLATAPTAEAGRRVVVRHRPAKVVVVKKPVRPRARIVVATPGPRVVLAAPRVDRVWVAGTWRWAGPGRRVWVAGHWSR